MKNSKVVPLSLRHINMSRGDGMQLEQLKEADFIRELIAKAIMRAEKEGKYQPKGESA